MGRTGEHLRTQISSYEIVTKNLNYEYPTSRFFSFSRNMQILTLVCLITNNFGETLDEVITDEIWDENDFLFNLNIISCWPGRREN